MNKYIVFIPVILLAFFACGDNENQLSSETNPPIAQLENHLIISSESENPKLGTHNDFNHNKAPALSVILTSGREPMLNRPLQSFQAVQLSTQWHYDGGNGDGNAYKSQSPHALYLSDYENITLRYDHVDDQILIQFQGYNTLQPQELSVKRWDAALFQGVQDIRDTLDHSEAVELNDTVLRVKDDGYDYIYEVIAKWTEGSAAGTSVYAFRVDSANENKTESMKFSGVVEPHVSPWTDTDIHTAAQLAWGITESHTYQEHYYKEYRDCFFSDIDNDSVPELILTKYMVNYMRVFVFKKVNDEVIPSWDEATYKHEAPYFDTDISKGSFCSTIIDKDGLQSILDNAPSDSIVINDYILQTVDDDFNINNAPDGNKYITGFTWIPNGMDMGGNNFWIKQITLEDGFLVTNTLYRWGIFNEWNGDGFDVVIRYYKCFGGMDYFYSNQNSVEVTESEVKDFIDSLLVF